MKSVFVDTGYLLALELIDDQRHQAALSHWNQIKNTLPRLVTTTYVFDEVVTFLNSKGLHSKAMEVGNRLLKSPSVNLIHVDEDLFATAWQYFQNHDDKAYSLTDCASFVVMEKQGIRTALAFDKHFVQAGFAVLPGYEA